VLLKPNTTGPRKPSGAEASPTERGAALAGEAWGEARTTSPRKRPGLSLVCFRKRGPEGGRQAGSRWRQLSIGQGIRLTTSLTNGNKRLLKGPAHRGEEGGWRLRRQSLLDIAQAGGPAVRKFGVRLSLPASSLGW
jgi:hypothetical protein